MVTGPFYVLEAFCKFYVSKMHAFVFQVEDFKGGKEHDFYSGSRCGNEWALLQILQKCVKELWPWKRPELLGKLIWQVPDWLDRFFLSNTWLYWENHRRACSKWRQINMTVTVMLMVIYEPGYPHYVLNSLWCSSYFICFLSPTWGTMVDRKLVFNKDLLKSNLKGRPIQASTMAKRLWERTLLHLQKNEYQTKATGKSKSIYFISWKLSHVYFIHSGILDNCLIHSKALQNNHNQLCDILEFLKLLCNTLYFHFCVGRLFNII